MSPAELLKSVAREGVRVFVRGEQLVLAGRIDQVPAGLIDEVRARKSEVVRHLRGDVTYPASFGQARLAFLHQLDPSSPAYNVSASVRLRGPCNIEALKESLTWLVDRHAALRTSLATRDGQPVAAVADHLPVHLPLVDLSQVSAPEAELEIDALRRQTASTPFDLSAPPLWRCLAVRRGPEDVEIIAAVHHFVADGWSVARALREVALIYSSTSSGRAWILPPVRTRYSDYASWLARHVEGPTGRSDLDWWRMSLAGADTPVALRPDHPRPTVRSDTGDRITFPLGRETTALVRRFAAERRTTVSAVISAVHAVLLHRYSGSVRFLLGVAVSNRAKAEFHDVFGFFVNWVPLLADVSDEPSFETFLRRWEQARLEALQHQSTPFDFIARATGCEADLSRHPLFQHMVVSHVAARHVHFGDLSVSLEPLPTGTSKVDMTLFITDSVRAVPVEGCEGILLEIEYSTELFERPTVSAFGQALVTLLRSAIETASAPVALLRLVDGPTAQHLRNVSSRSTSSNISSPLPLIVDRIQRQPDRPAIVAGGRVVQYGELGERAAMIATALRQSGIGSGDRVALFLPRVPDLIAAILGTLIRGATFIPLDSTLPPARLWDVLDDAHPAILLTTAHLAAASGPFASVDSVRLVEELLAAPAEAVDRLEEVDDAAPAYLIYTSGSTGRPKGVFGGHRPLGNFVEWLNNYLGCDVGDRVLCKTPVSFDASLREIIAPLCAGATLVLADDDAHADPEMLGRMIADEGITILHSTPTIYREILTAAAEDAQQPAGGRWPALRHVMCGGEVLSGAVVRAHFAAAPSARLHNVYGPTECTIDVTVHEVRADDDVVPLGSPIPGAMVYVAAADLSPLPPGAEGEIVIGGVPVGPGYWQRPDEEQQRFVVPAAGVFAGERMYRTGDRGWRTVDGHLLFGGRIDRQVKVQGARVELGEIERVMEGHPGVLTAVALLREETRHSTLVGVVRFSGAVSDPAAEIDHLRTTLASRLPRFMRPAELIHVKELPHLVSGKLDRRALLDLCTPGQASPSSAAFTQDEALVASLMADLVERPVASTDVDFFRAGGHSLGAARLVARLARQTGIRITLRELFEQSTVAGVAALLAAKRAAGPADTAQPPPIETLVRPRGYRG